MMPTCAITNGEKYENLQSNLLVLTKFQVPMCTMPTSATSPEDLSSSKSTTLTGVWFANIYAYDIHTACVTGQVKYKSG